MSNTTLEDDPDIEIDETECGKTYRHPSYATIGFYRQQTHDHDLFGSSIKHRNTISCVIYNASLTRDLSSDWIHGENKLIEVEMSYSQFAEAITSLNMGTGVPCTLQYLKGSDKIPPCHFSDKKKEFTNELTKQLTNTSQDLNDLIAEMDALFSKKNLNKSDKENIMSKMRIIQANMNQNITFMFEQFQKQMDKTVVEAKGEVEAFVQNKIQQIATMAISEKQDESKLIPTENPIDI